MQAFTVYVWAVEEPLTLFRGESGKTGSSAARAMLLMAITDRMLNSKYFRVRM